MPRELARLMIGPPGSTVLLRQSTVLKTVDSLFKTVDSVSLRQSTLLKGRDAAGASAAHERAAGVDCLSDPWYK